jgi:Tfp pilus assembly protein PilV
VAWSAPFRLIASQLRRALKRAGDRGCFEEAGFGLIEILVSLVILLVVLVPATYVIDSAVQQTSYAKQKIAAVEVAEQELEQLANEPLTQLNNYLDRNKAQGSQTVAGVVYSVSTYLHWQGVGSSPDLCATGSPPVSMSATAIVSWGQNYKLAEQQVIDPPYSVAVFTLGTALSSGRATTTLTANTNQTIPAGAILTIGVGTTLAEANVTVSSTSPPTNSETINLSSSFTPSANYPVGTPVSLPNDGYLAVQINGASGGVPSDISQVSVQISSSTTGASATFYPDSTGCVYESEIPGSYTVTLGSSSTPPFINAAEALAPATTWTVAEGSTTTATLTFDQADSVSFSASGSVPVAPGTPVSVQNSNLLGSGSSTWATVIPLGSSSSTANLFPFTSSYSTWYGDCLAEEPVTPATVGVSPGASTAVSVTGLGTLTVEGEKKSSPGTAWGSATTVSAVLNDPNSSDLCPSDTFSIPTNSNGISQAAMVEANRLDSSTTWGSGVSTITDSNVTSADQGRLVVGTGIPANTFVGTVTTAGTLPLVTSSGAVQKTTSAGTSLSLVGENYTVTVTAPDNNSVSGTMQVTPAGVEYGGVFYATGTAVPVLIT